MSWPVIWFTLSSNLCLLVWVKSGLFISCQFNLSNFLHNFAACASMSMVEMTPVCWQAFDVANIWGKLNIRSRSTQAKHLLMLPIMLNKKMEIWRFYRGNKWNIVEHVGMFKGSCTCIDLDVIFTLTQILATSKACWHTGVNLLCNLSL